MGQSFENSDFANGSRVLIEGAGLAGCMALVALKWRWPELDIRLTSQHPMGEKPPDSSTVVSKTWCFHEGDVQPESWAWLTPYVSHSWAGYDVHFPRHSRSLSGRYHAIRSTDFFNRVRANFPIAFQLPQLPVSESKFDLKIKATGWPSIHKTSDFGWQKFVGIDLKLKSPHGLSRPILKDARIEQIDGYRFFYCLPWSEKSLLIEDTYYSNSPDLDVDKIRQRIFQFAQMQGWEVESEERMEQGALPLDMGMGDSPEPRKHDAQEISIGAASGLAHPVTGYTTSTLLQQIESMVRGSGENESADVCDLPALAQRVKAVNDNLREGSRYFHLLNRMLFNAAHPSERYVVLERFYRLSPDLISRFYAGRLNWADRARILIGRPPVPLFPAIREFVNFLPK
jgi:lycopene beta-cyclase